MKPGTASPTRVCPAFRRRFAALTTVVAVTAALASVAGEAKPDAVELNPEQPISIGRSRDNTIVLPRDEHASRLHAKIYFENGRWYVRDFGLNGIARRSQLRISDVVFNELNSPPLGCPALDAGFNCIGGTPSSFERNLPIIGSSNWVPRMPTGGELQVILPIVNGPFRVYSAYNPLCLESPSATPTVITRDMVPAGGAAGVTFKHAQAAFTQNLNFREPRKTFRFTVSTTF